MPRQNTWPARGVIGVTPNITYQDGDIRRMQFTDNSFDEAVSTLALDVLPEIEQVVSEMKRVTRPGGIVASAVTQFLGGMSAFDLMINTAAVLDASIREVRDARAGRQQFWPDGPGDAVAEDGPRRCCGDTCRRRLRVFVIRR
jgi:SAM-dependent methyltransferase